MKPRVLPLLLVALLTVSCGGDAAEDTDAAAATEAAGEGAMADAAAADEAALEQLRADYVQHYNMHHASVVADMYTDSAVWLGADGNVHQGKAAILASLEQAMGGTPTLTLTNRDMMVFGDRAVAIGDYGIQTTPPGADPIALNGHFIADFRKVDGAWKAEGVITNYNAAPPEGMPAPPAGDSEPPPESGTMTDMITAYETHFNLGHADMVADLFTDDATVAFGNLPIGTGRAAVLSSLEQRFAMGDSPQVDLHDVYTMDFGNGWAIDYGWYTITATAPSGPVGQTGAYITLARQQADGTWKMHWMVSNAQPTTN